MPCSVSERQHARTSVSVCRFVGAERVGGKCTFRKLIARSFRSGERCVTIRMCSLLLLAHRVGTQFVVENPADPGDLSAPKYFLNAEHGPLWLFPAVLALA